jgi:phage FluMu gp28-like protein
MPRQAQPFFLPYQREWLLDRSRLRLCQKSRQIGLSYADSYDSVRKAAVRPGGRDVWVMSRDENQAKQYIRYCKHWAKILNLAAVDYGRRVLTTTNGKAASVQMLTFASRATIYALSSNPDAIVGKTGHVKLDEFALHKDQRTLYAVAKPVIQWGGTLSIISTHRGAGTVFNELITDICEKGNRMGWSLHTIPIQKAVEQGLVEKILGRSAAASVPVAGGDSSRVIESSSSSSSFSSSSSSSSSSAGISFQDTLSVERERTRQAWLEQQHAECIDEEQWLQEYCCIPADEAAAFISYDLINACTEPELRLLTLGELEARLSTLEGPLFLGLDVARNHDLCVLDVGEKIGDVVWDRVRLEFLDQPFAEIESALYRLLRLKQLRRACVDATGLGMQLAERAREKFGWKIEPLSFTERTKEDLAISLKIDLEKRQLRLVDDDQLRADLRGIRKEVTLGGHSRYAGESEGSHCDRFWAKALRQQAARHRVSAGALVG